MNETTMTVPKVIYFSEKDITRYCRKELNLKTSGISMDELINEIEGGGSVECFHEYIIESRGLSDGPYEFVRGY